MCDRLDTGDLNQVNIIVKATHQLRISDLTTVHALTCVVLVYPVVRLLASDETLSA